MGYVAWSVVFGEQPSASKWNILGTNDASFNDGTGIASLAITTAKIADDAITDDKLLNGKIYRRQGGSSTAWNTAGANNYDYSDTDTIIQCGVKAITTDPTIITFPVAFSQIPLMVGTQMNLVSSSSFVRINSVTTSQASVTMIDAAGAVDTSESISWIAVGV